MTEEKDLPEPPVKEDDILEVEIISKGSKGDGIAKKDGFIIIIPEAKFGQRCSVRITKISKKYAFAMLIENL